MQAAVNYLFTLSIQKLLKMLVIFLFTNLVFYYSEMEKECSKSGDNMSQYRKVHILGNNYVMSYILVTKMWKNFYNVTYSDFYCKMGFIVLKIANYLLKICLFVLIVKLWIYFSYISIQEIYKN